MKIIYVSNAESNIDPIIKSLKTGEDVLLKSVSADPSYAMPREPVTFPDRSAFRAKNSSNAQTSKSVIESFRDSERY